VQKLLKTWGHICPITFLIEIATAIRSPEVAPQYGLNMNKNVPEHYLNGKKIGTRNICLLKKHLATIIFFYKKKE
jgi:hypothetical protein